MRFLTIFVLVCCGSSISYAQMESNFFQQNQILFNPAALSSDSEIEGLAGAKTSSYEFLRRPFLLYNAAGVRINRFSVVGTSDFLWNPTINSGNISLSAGYTLIKTGNISVTAAIGAKHHWWKLSDKFVEHLDIVDHQDPLLTGANLQSFGLKSGVFIEGKNFQAGAAGYRHEYSNEVVFHGQFKLATGETWSIIPAFRIQGYKYSPQHEMSRREWSFDILNSVVFKDKISGILGYRNLYSFHTFILGATYRINEMVSIGYAFDTYRVRSFADPGNYRNINAHELTVKANIN